MKQKTATIRIRPIFGCKSDCADVTYRGKLIYTIEGNCVAQKLLNTCVTWCMDNGFTHTKIILG